MSIKLQICQKAWSQGKGKERYGTELESLLPQGVLRYLWLSIIVFSVLTPKSDRDKPKKYRSDHTSLIYIYLISYCFL